MNKITYCKKIYQEGDIDISYFAIMRGHNLLLLKVEQDITDGESDRIIFHTYKDSEEYNTADEDYEKAYEEICGNEDYLISKTEYNRLYQKYRDCFK